MKERLQKLIEKLNKQNIWYRLIELGHRAISAKDVERLADVDTTEIYKTILLTDGRKYFTAFLSGDKRIDLEKVSKVFSHELRLAKAKEIKENFNVEPGEVCPLLINVPIVFDISINQKEKVNFGSGDLYYGIEMKVADLINLLKPKIENISEQRDDLYHSVIITEGN